MDRASLRKETLKIEKRSKVLKKDFRRMVLKEL
jgi:hypothetical protein